jgi:hypothetical protein
MGTKICLLFSVSRDRVSAHAGRRGVDQRVGLGIDDAWYWSAGRTPRGEIVVVISGDAPR